MRIRDKETGSYVEAEVMTQPGSFQCGFPPEQKHYEAGDWIVRSLAGREVVKPYQQSKYEVV